VAVAGTAIDATTTGATATRVAVVGAAIDATTTGALDATTATTTPSTTTGAGTSGGCGVVGCGVVGCGVIDGSMSAGAPAQSPERRSDRTCFGSRTIPCRRALLRVGAGAPTCPDHR